MSTTAVDWQSRPLASVCTLEYGSSLPERARTGGSVPIFGSSGHVGWHDRAITDGPTVLVGRKGAAGSVHYSEEPCWPIDTTFFARPADDIDPRWLYYALRSLDLASLETSTAIPSLSREHAYRLSLGVPSRSEQRRIASRLDAAMADIAAARAALAREREGLVSLETAAVEAALGGRSVASADDPVATEPGWVTLSEVARLESGHTPSRKQPEWWGGDIPWIALPDIRSLDGKAATTTSERTNALGIANSSARVLPEGTVVLCRDVNVGLVTVMAVPMATSQHFVNWVPGQALRPWYLAHALINARSYLRGLSEGSLIKTIYMPTLKNMRVRLPSLEAQDRMLESIDEVRNALRLAAHALDRQTAALDAFGPVLLNAAFRGDF